ncbi:hypothetical protein BDZ97DRAFT_1787942, partial [Flammula alnicola]
EATWTKCKPKPKTRHAASGDGRTSKTFRQSPSRRVIWRGKVASAGEWRESKRGNLTI